MKRIIRAFITISVSLTGLARLASGIDYAYDMPFTPPDYPGIGNNPYEQRVVEIGEPQSGLYYESVHSTYGPTTAGSEDAGICDGTTISASQTQKYNLACSVLYALFGLNASWANETTVLESQTFETCCQGGGCTVPKKYIHKCWSYTQRGKVTEARVKVNEQGQLSRNGVWCNWKYCSPCDASYCTLYVRTGYSSSSSNLAGSHDPSLHAGLPAGSPCTQ